MKYAKESFIKELTPLISNGKVNSKYNYDFWTYYVQKYNINDSCEDEDDDDYVYENMYLPLKDFIEYQSESIFYYNQNRFYRAIFNSQYNFLYCEKHHIKYYKGINLPDNIIDEIIKEKDQKIENILKIAVLLLYYEFYNKHDLKIKILKILIFSNYLLCWLYILIMSYSTLSSDPFTYIYEMKNMEEPFSLLNIHYFLTN